MSKYPGRVVTDLAPAGYSVAFDGSGDYLTVADSSTLEPSNSNFTIECWIYPTATGSFLGVFSKRATNANYSPIQVLINSGTMILYASTDGSSWAVNQSASSSPSLNTWSHIAVVRNGTGSNNLTLYLNGTSVATGSVSSTALVNNTGAWAIGADAAAGTGNFSGYISNFRYVLGTAIYTAAFTPPTQLFNIPNTQLLTCNSPAIIDQSNNAFAITVNGDSKVSTFTPFMAYVPYNPALGASTPGVWTLDEALQAKGTRQWNMYDPYFNQTTLLLHGNGTNGAQNNTFLDSGTANSGSGFTITRNPASGPNAPTQGSFSPFSQTGWSVYLNGSSSLRDTSTSTVYHITGNFTVEGWYWFDSAAVVGDLFGIEESTTAWAAVQVQITTSRTLTLNMATTAGSWAVNSTSTATVALGTWNHIAVTRSGSSINLWLNGVSIVSASNSNALMTTGNFTIIGGRDAAGYITGYVSNFRFVNGTALYTSAFTPSTSPLTTTSQGATATEVELLTCQSNRFIDNSSNGFTFTLTGTPSVQSFSPFYPTAAYTPATVGGSGYFDGTGDYLSIADNTALDMEASSFTIETFIYLTSTPAASVAICGKRANTATFGGVNLYFPSNAAPSLLATVNGTTWGVNFSSTINVQINAWNHVAATRNGDTWTIWVNGQSGGTATVSGTVPNNASAFTVAATSADGGQPLSAGYLSNFRVVKGTALYTAAFTPPTAPLTNITNTSLLCNFTNAGIVDSTAKNVLETVGGAQISTTQSKFGGSSMYFDGTGDWLFGRPNPLLDIGSGDFTFETWLYITSTIIDYRMIIAKASSTNDTYISLRGGGVGGRAEVVGSGTAVTISLNNTISQNTWTHFAVVRSGTTVTIYVNGTSIGTGTLSTNVNFSDGVGTYIGRWGGATTYEWPGYLDDLRITRFARYTGNFTPQTSQWQDE